MLEFIFVLNPLKNQKYTWHERTSNSQFVASVWTCNVLQTTSRTVLADPCVSLTLIQGDNLGKVVLSGPGTKSRQELLPKGYTYTSIRLKPGVLQWGFSAAYFMDKFLTFSTDAALRFYFGGKQVQFHNFANAELLVEQLDALGYLSSETPKKDSVKTLPAKSYYRLIKRSTGLSPYQLHQIERIYKALRLLKQGMPIISVAAKLDFTDQSHLTHASKHYLGHTPKQLLQLPQTLGNW